VKCAVLHAAPGRVAFSALRFSARNTAEARRIMASVIPASELRHCVVVTSTGFIRDNSHAVIK